MESIPANKSCNKHDPPTAKIPEVINNEPNVFNSRHEANKSIIFRDQKEKVINKTSSMQTRGYPISHEDAIRIMTKAGVTDYFNPSFGNNSLVYKYFILTFWNI